MTTEAVRMEIAQAQVALKRASDLLSDSDVALTEANYRLEATQMVIAALLATVGRFGLNRRKFRELVSEAGRHVPDEGPASVMHHILLVEGRKVQDLEE